MFYLPYLTLIAALSKLSHLFLYVLNALSFTYIIPDSLTREEGSVNRNVKHPCQTVLPVTPYMAKTPFLLVLRLHNFK
jgi:hypothetical protein